MSIIKNLNKKRLGIYYHMPFLRKENGSVYANPVMGTFIESLADYFGELVVFGFESIKGQERITYKLKVGLNLNFVSLGPEGQFWDYFQKMDRLKKATRLYKDKIEFLLLRLPSHRAFAIWKNLGKPPHTILLFVGNPFYVSESSVAKRANYLFPLIRSKLHDNRIKIITKESKTLVFANSKELVNVWGNILKVPVNFLHTNSISRDHIVKEIIEKKFKSSSHRLLFVGRICFDKGIRELFDALNKLNKIEPNLFHLDLVGPVDDLEGFSLAELIDKYNVSSMVTHHGYVAFGDQLFEHFKAADAFILPSYHEGMPHAVWESMSQSTPIIVTRVGGMKDGFEDGKDVLFIKMKDSNSIVEAVMTLKKNKKLVEVLQKNGLRKVAGMTRESQSEILVEKLIAKQ